MRSPIGLSLVAAVVVCVASAEAADGPVTVDFDGGATYRFTEAEKKRIAGIANRAYRELRELLPSLAPELELKVTAGSRVIEETGDLGAAVAPGVIAWTVDPGGAGGVAGIADKRLRATLFHEAHHQARGWVMQGGKRPASFMEAVISEGLATAFERDAAGSQPLWGDYPEEIDGWVEELRGLSLAEGFGNYPQWMFRHADGRRWIGYRAGTYIADRAIARSGRSAAELAQTPADEVLELAGLKR